MYHRILFLVAALAGVGFASGSVWAAHHEGGDAKGKGHHKRHGKHMFEKKDADGNGEVSKAEWLAASEARFADADTDGNGSITQQEWQDAHDRMKKRWMKKRDTKSAP
jgi:hypothetical protein